MKLTVKQAAAGLGVSAKTIRRRIGEGALSASKELRGKQELVLIDAAELARYAEAANLRLDVDKIGQAGAAAVSDNGQPSATLDAEDLPVPAVAWTETSPNVANHSHETGFDGQVRSLRDSVMELRSALDEARQREAWLQERVQAAEAAAERERERASEERQRLMDLIPKALPPAPSWWQRIFRTRGSIPNNG